MRTDALHPGGIASEIWRHAPQFIVKLRRRSMITPEEGAQTTLYCASADAVAEQTGLYYDQCQIRQPSALASNQAPAEELWRYSERALPK